MKCRIVTAWNNLYDWWAWKPGVQARFSSTLFLCPLRQMTMQDKEIHIGHIIKEELKRQGRTAHWLADQIPCSRTHIYKIFQSSGINTELLQRISTILEHNFFHYFID